MTSADNNGPRPATPQDPGGPASTPQDIDLREYILPVWKRKWIVLAIVVVVTGAVYAYSSTRPKQYTAATSVFVQTSPLDQALFNVTPSGTADRNTANQAQLLDSRNVADAVAKRIAFKGDPAA